MGGRQLFRGILLGNKIAIVIGRVYNERVKLIGNRDLVLGKVEAVEKTEKVNNTVSEWLNDVEKFIQEMENQVKEIKIKRGVNSKWVYALFVEMLKKMKTLNAKCDFVPFSSPIPGLEHFSCGNFVSFKPTKEASDKLLEALQDEDTRIIGLYGRRGSDKTKLVKALGEKAKYLNIFDAVLFATVSQNPDVKGIQDEIADYLNLQFDRTTEAGRARTISSALQSRGRILVILDDVWAKLELQDIGIPCNGNGCKVLLTTRSQGECALMECQREIPLGPLSKEEAWMLFKKHSDIDDESPSNLLKVAQEVAFLCKGLPGKIKEEGSSLKGKPIKEWRAALDRLKHSMAQWDIFLSFRGEDTRHSFTGFLYDALCREGFNTFMDDGGLHSGDEISSSLINAIEASRLSIVVLSENYAYSSWCLDELVKILECKKMNNQLVWPIFYKVEPSDIRHQRNSYGKAMAEHENFFGKDSEKVQKWRSALFEVSNLSGKTYTTGYEYEFIQKIVEDANNNKNHLYIRSMNMD